MDHFRREYFVNLKFLFSILMNLLRAYDPRRPHNQAKRWTLQ